MDIIWPDYEIIVSQAEEIIPPKLENTKAPAYLAELKANDLLSKMPTDFLLITADTVVIHQDEILGKPKDREDALSMVSRLAGTDHDVISGVCVMTHNQKKVFSSSTSVTVDPMTSEEVVYYVDNYQVMDKAGSYGVQDWLGVSKVSKLDGSYYNVMGLPVDKLYQVLRNQIAILQKDH